VRGSASRPSPRSVFAITPKAWMAMAMTL
jgi:hypothetical protein